MTREEKIRKLAEKIADLFVQFLPDDEPTPRADGNQESQET
jgi:hypothetical protein